jgi:RimJ/RimL family protein N-acetyltransferase
LIIDVRSPFPAADLPLLYGWCQPVWDKVADDLTPTEPADFVNAFWLLSQEPSVTTYGVFRDGELGGYVRFEQEMLRPWTGQAHAIFKQSFWGRETTRPALFKIAREIFELGVERISLSMFVDHASMRALVTLLGARFEGVITKQTIQNGKLIDSALYGLTLADLEAAEAGRRVDSYSEVVPRSLATLKSRRGGHRKNKPQPATEVKQNELEPQTVS